MYYLQFYGRTIFVVFVLLPKYTAVWQMVVLHGLSEMAVLRWNKWFAQNYYTSLSDLVERMTMWSPDCEFNALTLESPHNPAIFILSNSWTIASSPYFFHQKCDRRCSFCVLLCDWSRQPSFQFSVGHESQGRHDSWPAQLGRLHVARQRRHVG